VPVSQAPGLGRPLLAIAIIIFAVVYGSSAVTSEDAIWFVPARLDEPAAVTVYQAGLARPLPAGSAERAAVVEALGEAVRGTQAAARAGLSEDTLQTLTRGPGEALEVRFDRPQRLGGAHTRGRPTRMLVALAGPFGQDPYVFLGDDRGWWAEALVSPHVADVRRAVTS
jgi:hypothetical protein